MTKARTLADNFAADINGITAGTGITGGGTSGTVTVTNSMATAIDAKGDLVVGTGADTFSRLAVASTAGYLLSVDSAETTGLKWAAPAGGSGLTLVTKSSFSAVTSHSINSCFSATYDFYEVKIAFTASSGAPDFTIRLRASGTDDSADYAATTIYAFGATLGSNANNALGTDEFFVGGSGSTTANYTAINAQICNPFKSQVTTLFADSSYGTSNVFNFQNIGYHNDAGSFDGFTLLASTGTMTGTIYVYGLAV